MTLNFPSWTRQLQAAACVGALALMTACGGGGGGSAPSSRFENITFGALSAVKDTTTGIIWAASLEPISGAVPSGQLPTALELLSVADTDREQFRGKLDFLLQGIGKQVQAAETVGTDSSRTWAVDFRDYRQGAVSDQAVSEEVLRWRVLQRPVSNAPSLTDMGDGSVVQDRLLLWSMCAVRTIGSSDCTGTGRFMTLDDAKRAASQSRLLGYSDWRLPTKQELQSLLRLSNTVNSLLPPPFATQDALNLDDPVQYWTSSTYTFSGRTDSWVGDFSLALDPGGMELFPANSMAMVRLVRTLR